jgi:transposase
MAMRKKYSAAFKAKVALAAIREKQTIAEICSDHSVAASQIYEWKKAALGGLEQVFVRGSSHRDDQRDESLVASLYQQIGQLKVENDWLKKRL